MESVDAVVRANLRRMVGVNLGDMGFLVRYLISEKKESAHIQFAYEKDTGRMRNFDVALPNIEDEKFDLLRVKLNVDPNKDKGNVSFMIDFDDKDINPDVKQVLEKTVNQYNERLGYKPKETTVVNQ